MLHVVKFTIYAKTLITLWNFIGDETLQFTEIFIFRFSLDYPHRIKKLKQLVKLGFNILYANAFLILWKLLW